MDGTTSTRTRRSRRRSAALAIGFVFVVAIGLEGCGTTQPAGVGMASAMPTMAAAAPVGSAPAAPAAIPADATEAWLARPDFTRVDAQTEEAYSYALFRPDVVQWMPCYCGCARMDHRSNLDCYLQRTAPGASTEFEEHASYCEVCVQTTLMAKHMVSDGKSLLEIRQAVDQEFGGGAPGTPTQLPPA